MNRIKRYFDLPEQRRVLEIPANGMMAKATAEQISAQEKAQVREVNFYEYDSLKRKYSKPYEPEQQSFFGGKS